MAGIVPGCWIEWAWGLGTQKGASPRSSEIGMLAAHDARTTHPYQAHQKLLIRKLVNRSCLLLRARCCSGPAAARQKARLRRTNRYGGKRRERDSPMPATEASRERELPPAFRRGQRTPFESSPHQSSWGVVILIQKVACQLMYFVLYENDTRYTKQSQATQHTITRTNRSTKHCSSTYCNKGTPTSTGKY